MTERERAALAVAAMETAYPDAVCSLTYETPFQLLIATRLSAQCTDARVNLVTPALFRAFPDASQMEQAPVEVIEEYIKTCGLYHSKAKDLIGIAQGITRRFGGRVPDTIEELITLPGVGRKTANLVCGDIYGQPAVVTDTHFIRLCNRLGFVNTRDPLQVERKMRVLLKGTDSNGFCHRAVLHGRQVCTARKALCERCCLAEICKKRIKK